MRMLFLLFIVLCFVPKHLHAEQIHLKMGYFAVAPHLFQTEDNQTRGALIDFFDQQILKNSQFTAHWYGPNTHARLMKMLESGEIDGMALLIKTEEREKFLYYSHAPFYLPQSVMIFLKESSIDTIQSADDLIGQRIGFLLGIKGTPFLSENKDKLTMNSISGKDWIKRNLMRLQGKRIDAVFIPELAPARYVIAKMNIGEQLKLLNVPEPPIQLYFVFSKKSPNALKILKHFNDKTKDVQATQKKYLKFLESYF
jgi:ABC-type amino acid transport substrate-binding protein